MLAEELHAPGEVEGEEVREHGLWWGVVTGHWSVLAGLDTHKHGWGSGMECAGLWVLTGGNGMYGMPGGHKQAQRQPGTLYFSVVLSPFSCEGSVMTSFDFLAKPRRCRWKCAAAAGAGKGRQALPGMLELRRSRLDIGGRNCGLMGRVMGEYRTFSTYNSLSTTALLEAFAIAENSLTCPRHASRYKRLEELNLFPEAIFKLQAVDSGTVEAFFRPPRVRPRHDARPYVSHARTSVHACACVRMISRILMSPRRS